MFAEKRQERVFFISVDEYGENIIRPYFFAFIKHTIWIQMLLYIVLYILLCIVLYILLYIALSYNVLITSRREGVSKISSIPS